MSLFDNQTRLAETSAVVWLLGFGFGGATGIALVYAIYAVYSGMPSWIVITATLISAVHASIIASFWLYRQAVRRMTALMVSMIASAILMCSLAWIIGNTGLQKSPLYGLAGMHLIMAFSHPVHFANNRTLG